MIKPRFSGLLALTLCVPGTSLAQSVTVRLEPGTPVRIEMTGERNRWHSGRLLSLDADSLVVQSDGGRNSFAVRDVAVLQARRGGGSRTFMGAAIGAGTALALAAAFGDGAGSSDVVGIVAGGALVGAAWGSATKARWLGGIGLFTGATVGAVAFGVTSAGCESGASRGCHIVVGGAFIGSIGLIAGTAIGLLVPNWESIPVDLARLGTHMDRDGGFTLSWKVGF